MAIIIIIIICVIAYRMWWNNIPESHGSSQEQYWKLSNDSMDVKLGKMSKYEFRKRMKNNEYWD